MCYGQLVIKIDHMTILQLILRQSCFSDTIGGSMCYGH